MRSAAIIVSVVFLGTACMGSQTPSVDSTKAAAFDSVRVAAEVDSVMNRLIHHQLAAEFDEFNSHYTASPKGTAVGDGNFFASIPEFLTYMEPVFASVDSIPSFEWLHYKTYPISSSSAVFAGQYREMVAMSGAPATSVIGSFTALFQKRDADWEITHVHSSHVR